MKLGPVTKIDNENTATSKKIDDVVMSANLEQRGSWIPDAWSVIIKFPLTVTFYLKMLETELKTF